MKQKSFGYIIKYVTEPKKEMVHLKNIIVAYCHLLYLHEN